MTNVLKILKAIIYLSLFISLIASLIYLFFPDLYASYITGYSTNSIIEYRNGDLNQNLLCKDFFPREVLYAINGVGLWSILMFIISFVSVVIFKLLLIIKRKSIPLQPRNTMRNFLILLFVSYLMSFAVFISDYTYHYVVGCEQLQASCENIRANPENVGAKSMEELHTRGEYLYCD